MRIGIVGRKVGMTQIFDGAGGTVPVTVIDASECVISQVKTKGTDGYNAIQVAYGKRKPQNVNKPRAGHFKKAGIAPKLRVKEIRFEETDDLAPLKTGGTLAASIFKPGDRVDVSGIVRGKGFQGVMKRHGFKGKDATHGTHEYFRHGGSIGTNTFPGRVLKNKGMPGQTGNVPRTIQGIQVADVKGADNLILLKGAVPGPRNSFVTIRLSRRAKDLAERKLEAPEA